VEGLAHSKRKEEQPLERKMMVVHLDWLAPYQGTVTENQAMGKEGEADHRCHKHNPQKRRNGGTPVGYWG
jgi:hypothetical protein